MENIKSFYLRNLLRDMARRSKIVTLFILLVTLVFSAIGFRNVGRVKHPTEKEKIEIEEYNSKISSYDEAISNIEESLKLAKNQVNELQNYVEKSIYMQLEPQNIQAVSAQYSVLADKNVENILASLAYFINEGGILENVSTEYPDLQAEYWKDIIFCSISGNVLNLTIYHYETDKAKKIMDIVEQKLFELVPEVAQVQGEFVFEKLNSTNYVKADINITNTQNNNKNNLKSYLANVADFDNKLISQKNAKSDFVKKNEPEILIKGQMNTKKEILQYGILGIIFGTVLTLGYFMLKYILGNRIKSKEDLINSNLNIIGCYTSRSAYKPELDRSMVDLEFWANEHSISKIYLNALCESETVVKVINDMVNKISEINLLVQFGYHAYDNAEDLKRLVESKYCILLVQIGKTTFSEIEQHINLCEKFHVKILGCMVVD